MRRVYNPIIGPSTPFYISDLDYRILVLGDFGGMRSDLIKGNENKLRTRRIYSIRRKRDCKVVMQSISPRLSFLVPVKIPLCNYNDHITINLEFQSFQDFHPDTLVEKIKPLNDLVIFRTVLKRLKLYPGIDLSNESLISDKFKFDVDVAAFLWRFEEEYLQQDLTPIMIDRSIAEIDAALSRQMDEIIHHPEFQALESAWRGLFYLVENTTFTRPVKIEVLDVIKEELYEDLEHARVGGFEKGSGLWYHVYWGGYDKVGGHPYTVMVADYQFDNSAADIKLLSYLSILCEWAQVPFIGNVGPKFFGRETFEEVMEDRNLEERIEKDPNYTAWHELRGEERSKYIGLTIPRFLGRLPYEKDAEPTRNFDYTETALRKVPVGEKGGRRLIDHRLWLNSSYAMAANMVRCFEDNGWNVRIVGVDKGGRVDNLPVPIIEEYRQRIVRESIEVAIEKEDYIFTRMGIIALSHWRKTDYACFFQVPTVKQARNIVDPIARANEMINASLQYIMFMTRVAHYLKYMQLRHIGRNVELKQLEKGLTEWLENLITDMANPSKEILEKKPLRAYTFSVEPLADYPGTVEVELKMRPHMSFIDFDIILQHKFRTEVAIGDS